MKKISVAAMFPVCRTAKARQGPAAARTAFATTFPAAMVKRWPAENEKNEAVFVQGGRLIMAVKKAGKKVDGND